MLFASASFTPAPVPDFKRRSNAFCCGETGTLVVVVTGPAAVISVVVFVVYLGIFSPVAASIAATRPAAASLFFFTYS